MCVCYERNVNTKQQVELVGTYCVELFDFFVGELNHFNNNDNIIGLCFLCVICARALVCYSNLFIYSWVCI